MQQIMLRNSWAWFTLLAASVVGCGGNAHNASAFEVADAFHRRVISCAQDQGLYARYKGDMPYGGGPGVRPAPKSAHWTLTMIVLQGEPSGALSHPLEYVAGEVWLSDDAGVAVPLERGGARVHLQTSRQDASSFDDDAFCECMSTMPAE